MALTTVGDFINAAYDRIGVGADGEVLSAALLNKGLDEFNLLVSSLSGRQLLTTAQITESFPLVTGQASYLIGVNSIATPVDFNTTKPFSIESAFVRYTVTSALPQNLDDNPLQIITRGEYNAFPVKSIEALPERLFYDPGPTQQANQVGTIYLYPTPDNISIYTLFIISEKPLTTFSSISTIVTFPPVYHRALIYNLAMALAAINGIKVHPEVEQIADDAMSIIEGINSGNKRELVDLGIPTASHRANILTGQ